MAVNIQIPWPSSTVDTPNAVRAPHEVGSHGYMMLTDHGEDFRHLSGAQRWGESRWFSRDVTRARRMRDNT